LKIRPKLFLKIFGIAFAALLLLSLFSFWQRTQQVEVLVRDALNRDANWLALRFSNILNDRESSLANLAQNSVLRSYLRCHGSSPAKTIAELVAAALAPMADGATADGPAGVFAESLHPRMKTVEKPMGARAVWEFPAASVSAVELETAPSA